jgi:hypothetical protein
LQIKKKKKFLHFAFFSKQDHYAVIFKKSFFLIFKKSGKNQEICHFFRKKNIAILKMLTEKTMDAKKSNCKNI